MMTIARMPLRRDAIYQGSYMGRAPYDEPSVTGAWRSTIVRVYGLVAHADRVPRRRHRASTAFVYWLAVAGYTEPALLVGLGQRDGAVRRARGLARGMAQAPQGGSTGARW